MTIRIVTDSASDLPQSLADANNITFVPLSFRFGNEEFIDRQQLSVADFWARCASSPVLPETAAPSPGQFEAEFRRLAAEGATGIVVIALSSLLSATMQSAELAARGVAAEIAVRVVDSRSASMGQGITAIACAKLAATGASLDQVAQYAEQLTARTQVWAALDTLENLKKGGRISSAKAMFASALAIKPILQIRNGIIEEGGKQRTRSKALALLVDKVKEAGPIENLSILQAECDDVEDFVTALRDFYSGEIMISDIGAIIGSHTGPRTIGVTFHTQ
ncbi:MAG: DegV family protein [Actinobacteria bacterium]|nr:MAG: DegV family protein [Actinomycetota bacterium]